MRIAVTGDNHLAHLHNAETRVSEMGAKIASEQADITINLGDLTNGRLYDHHPGLNGLLGSPSTLYVLGNHDLWSPPFARNRKPNEAFLYVSRSWSKYPAIPLERSFSDTATLWRDEGKSCCVVGAMGFPDFEHPLFVLPKKTYETRHCTNDGTYIDLSRGWLVYTRRMVASFEKRLEHALSFGDRDVIVATHYPILESQYRLSRDDISAYFFCQTMGTIVKRHAAGHPDRRFWCFAAHAHDYCRGTLTAEMDNLVGMGLVADYGTLAYVVIDTEKGFGQTVKTRLTPEPCRMVVESVEGFSGDDNPPV
jgi:predicted phosphohydrolase